MITKVTAVLLALGLILVPLYIGQWINGLEQPPFSLGWLGLDWKFIKELAPAIGGAGVDAILIGGLAGLVATWLTRWAGVNRQRASINRRRLRRVDIDLVKELSFYSGALPLWDLKFTSCTVEDLAIFGTQFSRKGESASQLTDVVFRGCDFSRVDFRGCVLRNVRFSNCVLHLCDFSGAELTSNDGHQIFETARIVRCGFEYSTINGNNLREVDQRGCRFWGARFNGDSRLPDAIFAELSTSGLQDLEGGGYVIKSKIAFLQPLKIKNLLFVLRHCR